MKLVHPILNQPINWNECLIQSFVIENPKMYREFVEELYQQMEGSKGNFASFHHYTLQGRDSP